MAIKPVPYEELYGSPKLKINRKTATATRELLFDYDLIDDFIADMFPANGIPAKYPGTTNIEVKEISIEPFSGYILENSNPAHYTGKAHATVEYGTVEWLAESPFIHKWSIGSEFITFPSRSMKWLSDSLPLGEDVQGGIMTQTIEHTLTWKFVRNPPWNAIRDCVGCLNAEEFLEAPPETLLFLGAEVSQEFNWYGTNFWELSYKFSEKNNGTRDDPKGWNFWLRPNPPPPPNPPTARFEEALLSNGDRPYFLGDFFSLLVEP